MKYESSEKSRKLGLKYPGNIVQISFADLPT